MKPHSGTGEAADWVVRRDAGLSAVEQREFDAWLRNDPARQAEVERLAATWSALDRPLTSGVAEQVLGQIGLRRRHRRQRSWAAAGVGMAALVAVIFVLRSRPEARLRGVAAPGQVAVEHPSFERTLSDGSVIALKSDTDFSVHFTAATRLVVLHRGEALFEVTKNPQRPFIVQAGGVEVRAVGTAFTVQLRNRQVEVLVAEGRVALDRTSPPSIADSKAPTAPLAFLDAGSRAVVDSAPAPSLVPRVWAVPTAEMSERLAWSRPRLEFSGTLLPEAVALINQYNRAKFVIADTSLASVRVSGFIRVDNIAGFISMLEGSFGIKAERPSETEIVLRRAP